MSAEIRHYPSLEESNDRTTYCVCGQPMDWTECGWCEEGEVNRYEEDPTWYGSEDEAWEPCPVCGGTGGHWRCWSLGADDE